MRSHLSFLLLLLASATAVFANTDSAQSAVEPEPMTAAERAISPKDEPPIQDNSFLVEEAYNQADGVIQHISFVQFLNSRDIVYTQTDEWPLRSLKHQVSVTASVSQSGNYRRYGPGWGDTAINYRYQLAGCYRPATAARDGATAVGGCRPTCR